MKRKQPVYKGLSKTPVLVNDTSELSPEFFVITEFPKQLTAGKNVLKLRGNFDTLKHYSHIDIEILDSRGQPIYHEITNFVELVTLILKLEINDLRRGLNQNANRIFESNSILFGF